MATFIDTVFANHARQKGFLVMAPPPPTGTTPAERERLRAVYQRNKPGFGDLFRHILKSAETIDASNVTEWMFAETDRESWSLKDGDFPACIPPFKRMVVETRAPSRIISSDFKVPGAQAFAEAIMPKRWAVVLDSYTLEEAEQAWGNHHHDTVAEAKYLEEMQSAFEALAKDPVVRAKVKFVIIATVFAWTSGWKLMPDGLGDADSVIGPLSSLYWAVGATGDVVAGPHATMTANAADTVAAMLSVPAEATDEEKFDLAQGVFGGSLFYPALMTLTMMNCKNVHIEPVEPSAKLNRRREKDGKRPLVRYHTLVIDPFTKVVRDGAKTGSGGGKVSMHVVRGHLKDYRDGKGLFGKKKGLWWWSPHVTGSAEVGTVVKDYEVGKTDA